MRNVQLYNEKVHRFVLLNESEPGGEVMVQPFAGWL
jgi:hypothetical protein